MSRFTPVKLAYAVIEPTDGEDATFPPIIFLHGLTYSKENWNNIASLICNATKRKAYALDARNHGDSEWCDDFNFDVNTDDLFHFMDTYNIPKAVIIGHSMGGKAGMRAAVQKPERVEKLIVEDMYAKRIPESYFEMVATNFEQLEQVIKNVPKNVDEDEAKRYIFKHCVEKILKELKIPINPENNMHETIVLKRKPDGSYAYKANMSVIGRAFTGKVPLMSELKGSYAGPACFIYGDLSNFTVHLEEDHIRQFFPKAEFACIKGATHNVHLDNPAEFTDAVLEFLLKR